MTVGNEPNRGSGDTAEGGNRSREQDNIHAYFSSPHHECIEMKKWVDHTPNTSTDHTLIDTRQICRHIPREEEEHWHGTRRVASEIPGLVRPVMPIPDPVVGGYGLSRVTRGRRRRRLSGIEGEDEKRTTTKTGPFYWAVRWALSCFQVLARISPI